MKRRYLDHRRALLQEQIRKAEAQIDLLDSFGEDEYENGTVIWWGRKYAGNSKLYEFIALKAGSLWYVTGHDAGKAYSWLDLVSEHLGYADVETGVYVNTEWELLHG